MGSIPRPVSEMVTSRVFGFPEATSIETFPSRPVNLQALSRSLESNSTNHSPSAKTKGRLGGTRLLIFGFSLSRLREWTWLMANSTHSDKDKASGFQLTRPLSNLERVKKSWINLRIRSASFRAVSSIIWRISAGISGSEAKLSRQTWMVDRGVRNSWPVMATKLERVRSRAANCSFKSCKLA